jgi:hypothetical protein
VKARPKAAYEAFEDDPELEFEFFLAKKLHMTVGQLREDMSQDEFVRWAVYFGREAQRRELAQK